MNKFTVGARVRMKSNPSYGVGVVKTVGPDTSVVTIEFENRTGTRCRFCKEAGIREGYGYSTNLGMYEHLYDFLPAFKVGDRVATSYGEGVVKVLPDQTYNGHYAIELDRPFWGHECGGLTKDNHGAWVGKLDGSMKLLVAAPVEQPKVKTKQTSFGRKSQAGRILSFLLAGNVLTPIKARALFGTERLAARVCELRQAGHKIKSVNKADLNGKVYAEYSLRKAGRIAA